MGTSTYIPIATTTLESTVSSVTFGSIPTVYRDLVLISDLKTVSALGGYFGINFNNDTSNSYSEIFMWGTGSSATSAARSSVSSNFPFWDYTKSGAFSVFQILDYSDNMKHKTSLGRSHSPETVQVNAGAFRWANTAAISSITLTLSPRSFEAGCTFSLYGIAG